MFASLHRVGWRFALALLLAVTSSSSDTVSSAAQSAAQVRVNAERALAAGRYADVETLAQSAPADDALAVLRASALIARGEYAAAQEVLSPVAARTPTGDGALELGLLQLSLGRRVEGRRLLQVIANASLRTATARDLARAARASRALGEVEDAHSTFREAAAAAPTDAVIEAQWGELFVEKHQFGEAAKSFSTALKLQPDYAAAHLGLARAVLQENPPAAEQSTRRALELNPSLVGAHLLLAEMALSEDKKSDAAAAIASAQAINPHSLEAHALTAALRFIEGDDAAYKAAINAALLVNPTYGEAFRVVGEVASRYYRFDDAAAQTRLGLALDRDNARAHADLGAHLMRTGDETNARRALELAFKADPYDAVTFNLLALTDKLETFETITVGDLVIKLDPSEVAVMREVVPAIAQEAMEVLTKRWQFTPKGPILIEVFPVHDDFAVRTLGLPGMIGALGACFGRVVTIDSPKARPPGDFSFAATLWHELAHVITLQLSNQRVPRWLSEGISEYEETRARPEWIRNMAVPFAQALEKKEVLTLRRLNAGFQDPRTISLAYYQASLLVEHLVQRFGDGALRALVASYATGIDTETAFVQVLKADIDDVQRSFDSYLDTRFGALRKALASPKGFSAEQPLPALQAAAAEHPDSYAVQMALGRALAPSDKSAAIAAFERASALIPMATGEDSAYAEIATLSLAAGDKARAARALEAMLQYEHTAVQAARQLVTLLTDAGDQQRLQTALSRVVSTDPFDAAAHSHLGRLMLSTSNPAGAVRSFRVALAAGAADRAGAHADLAEALLRSGNRAEARRQALAALEIAPTYERAQTLLLQLADGSH